MSVEVIQLGPDPSTIPAQIGDQVTVVDVVEIPRPIGATALDDLTDVAGTATATNGQVLTKTADGQWRPMTPTGGGPGGDPSGPLSYLHTQDEPATVWLIFHGLSFQPSGIEVLDHIGERHYPELSYVDAVTVRLDFLSSVRGVARLS